MITVDQARSQAAATLRRRATAWAVQPPAGPALAVGLKPPSEGEALRNQQSAEAWARAWAAIDERGGLEVQWQERSWARLGRQRVPVRLVLRDVDAVADFVGGAAAGGWRRLRDRVRQARGALGGSDALDAALRRHGTEINAWSAGRFQQVLEVATWLVEHPVEGLRPRQLPVRGVDSKWVGHHRSVLTALHAAATGRADLGLVDADRRVRLRVLDPSLAVGGLSDVAAPLEQVAALDIRPDVIFVLENLETVLAMPSWPGGVVLHGNGYAVDAIADLPWLTQGRVLYWGDLDTHGFAILHRLRSHHRAVASVLMDVDTLLAHRDLWVPEPKPARGTFEMLTAPERAALLRLRDEGDVRLEQERIPWVTALASLRSAVTET